MTPTHRELIVWLLRVILGLIAFGLFVFWLYSVNQLGRS